MALEPHTFSYRSRTVTHYRIGNGEPLLFLHGWGTGSRPLQPLARELSGIRTCHLLDLPGFGASGEPAEAWSVDDYADLVVAFADRMEWDRFDLLVHSYGGRITLKLLNRPSVARRIRQVLITGGAGLKPKRSWRYYFRKSAATFLKRPLEWLPKPVGEPALGVLRRSALWKRLGSSDYQKLSGVMRETFVRSVTDHLDDLLPGIGHEVLLVWGEEDRATPLDQARRMEKGLAEATLITLPGAGHYAFLDRPKQFAAIAEAYFRTAGNDTSAGGRTDRDETKGASSG